MAVLSLGVPFKLLQGLDVFREFVDVVGVIVDIARLEEGFEFESGTKPQETARLAFLFLWPYMVSLPKLTGLEVSTFGRTGSLSTKMTKFLEFAAAADGTSKAS